MELIPVLPHLQAALNLTSAFFLVSAYRAIRRQDRPAHQQRMTSAVVVSGLFLVSYLIYHAAVGNVKFAGIGWIRPVYFTILTTHVLLAVLSLPLIFLTLRRAPWRDPNAIRCPLHQHIARKTLPIWLYVSLSGLVIYAMAFHLYRPA